MSDEKKTKTLGTWSLGGGLARSATEKALKRVNEIQETGRRGRKQENRKQEQK